MVGVRTGTRFISNTGFSVRYLNRTGPSCIEQNIEPRLWSIKVVFNAPKGLFSLINSE